jgi:hypothetical protein
MGRALVHFFAVAEVVRVQLAVTELVAAAVRVVMVVSACNTPFRAQQPTTRAAAEHQVALSLPAALVVLAD